MFNRTQRGQVHPDFLSDTTEVFYMLLQTKNTQDTEQSFICFTALQWKDRISLNSHSAPLGQCSTDILNLDADTIDKLKSSSEALHKLLFEDFSNTRVTKNKAFAELAQQIVNTVLDLLIRIPPYSWFLKPDFGRTVFLDLYTKQTLCFEAILQGVRPESRSLVAYLAAFMISCDEIVWFHTQYSVMLDLYFENFTKRTAEHYAVGLYQYLTQSNFQAMRPDDTSESGMTGFQQSRPAEIQYVPTRNPDNEKEYLIVERLVFNDIGSFLHVDFYRALMHGHSPRKCHNCGTYFLLLSGHNTCYCTNLAPGKKLTDKKHTCRDVGAHVKEAHEKQNRTPAQQEYDKVYNRLKTRKNRRKISLNEWNEQVAVALSYMEENESGRLSDAEYREIMQRI